MLNIAILDDKLAEALHTKNLLVPYMEKRHMDWDHMDVFLQGSQLLQSQRAYDMLFLDIEVGDENGIDIAKQFRITQPDIIIIVITSYIKYSIEGYKIQAARYLVKPVAQSLLYSELDEVLNTLLERQSIMLCDHQEERLLRICDIYYFESYGRKTQFHLRVNTEISRENVTHWADVLGNDFVECYKGVYVHVKYIIKIGKDTLSLDNKQILPLARRRVEEVRTRWIRYQEMSI